MIYVMESEDDAHAVAPARELWDRLSRMQVKVNVIFRCVLYSSSAII